MACSDKLITHAFAGTSSIVDETTHEPLLPILTLIVDTAFKLRKNGHRVVIVSSGAIGVGLRRMEVDKRPKHLAQLQVRSPNLYTRVSGCPRSYAYMMTRFRLWPLLDNAVS